MIDDQMDDFAPDAYSQPPGPRLPAHKLWDATYAHSNIEDECDEALIKIFGADYEKPDEWGFSDITYDPYDGSFELKGIVDGSWKPTVEQMAKAWKLGFERCWFCYENGQERYCDPGYGVGNLKDGLQMRIDAQRKVSDEAGHSASKEAARSGSADLVEKEFWRRAWGWLLRRPHA